MPPVSDAPLAKPSSPLRAAIHSALVQQAIVLLLASMILDGGLLAQICGFAFAAFWAAVGLLKIRRNSFPTKIDLALIRCGYLLVCLISFLVASFVWHLRDY